MFETNLKEQTPLVFAGCFVLLVFFGARALLLGSQLMTIHDFVELLMVAPRVEVGFCFFSKAS